MFGLFEKNRVSGFGLDVSESSIKAMQLVAGKQGFSAHGFAKTDIPPGIIANHSIVNPDKLAGYIQKTLAEGKIDSKYVVASIPEAKSFVRVINLPQMDEKQIETAVPFEFEQNIPIPVDQVYFDWQILNKPADGYELLVTATPKDYIDSLIDVLKKLKLKPVAFELESQAAARALLDADNLDSSNLIIDISELQSSLMLVSKNELQYTSSIPIGGKTFTESIARNLGISAPEAEQAKREQGLVADSKKRNIRQAILPVLDSIVDEIRNVMRFYDEHYKNHLPLKEVIVCGGGAKLLGLSDYVAARLNLGATHQLSNVVLGNSLRHLAQADASKVDGLVYTTAIGLAIRAAEFKFDFA